MSDSDTRSTHIAFGVRFAIHADEGFGAVPSAILPPTSRSVPSSEAEIVYKVRTERPGGTGGATTYHLSCDGRSLGHSRDREKILRTLASELHFHVAVHARDYLFVHAGVVRIDGMAVILPGRTLAGKSTLVRALVDVGAGYMSDEYAVLDPGGLVHSYPKPLSERQPQGFPVLHSAHSLGWVEEDDTGPVPPGLVVVTRYRPGAEWSPRPISPGRALMALFDNTVVARSRPGPALDVLARTVDGVRGVESERGEADEAAAEIPALLSARRIRSRP